MKKIALLLTIFGLLLFTVIAVNAQSTLRNMTNALSTSLLTDTVTNGGTATINAHNPGMKQSTTILVTLTEISGTTAGTLTLQGSMDGTNYVAIMQPHLQTVIPTATATDVATQRFHWVLFNNPFNYYRVSWTGTGTMSATIAGKILSR